MYIVRESNSGSLKHNFQSEFMKTYFNLACFIWLFWLKVLTNVEFKPEFRSRMRMSAVSFEFEKRKVGISNDSGEGKIIFDS